MDCGGKCSAMPLFVRSESGVALRLPPQSKMAPDEFIVIMPFRHGVRILLTSAATFILYLWTFHPELESRLQGGEAGLDAAVINIAADFDSQPAYKFRVLVKRKVEALPVALGQPLLDFGLDIRS